MQSSSAMPEDVGNRVMKRSGILALLIWLISVTQLATAASPQQEAESPFGTQLFQMLFEEQGLTPVSSPRDVLGVPEQSVIVLMGNVNGRIVSSSQLLQFMEAGGACLIASDTGTYMSGICSLVGGRQQTVLVSPALRYQNQPDCFSVRQVSAVSPLTRGVEEIVVNATGWIPTTALQSKRNPRIVATLPNPVFPRRASGQPIVVSLKFHPQANVVLCADPSIFTNDMLWHGSNVLFAINTVNTLSSIRDRSGNSIARRSKLLFVLDNNIRPTYLIDPTIQQALAQPLNLNLPDDALPQMNLDPEQDEDSSEEKDRSWWDKLAEFDEWAEKTLAKVNRNIDRKQQEDLLNNILAAESERRISPSRQRLRWLQALCLGVAMFVVFRIATRGTTAHQMMPRREMNSAQSMEFGKTQKSAEFGRAAGILAWEFCREITGSSDTAVWAQQLGGKSFNGRAPAKSAYLQQKLDRILKLAINTRTVHISRGEFETIGRNITKLREFHSSGKLMKTT